MTVRTERMRVRIWALTPGSSPKPPTPWSTPKPTGDAEEEDQKGRGGSKGEKERRGPGHEYRKEKGNKR